MALVSMMCHTLLGMPLKVMDRTEPREVRVGRQGRLVIPVSLRRALRLGVGDTLVARVERGPRLVLEKRAAALERLQARVARLPEGVSLARELLSERRREARRERGD